MVQVIKRGNLACNCPKCKSELEYTYDEISEHKINYDYLGGFDVVRGLECPVCKHIIRVK
jgi:uncharacterized protein with PIN domain